MPHRRFAALSPAAGLAAAVWVAVGAACTAPNPAYDPSITGRGDGAARDGAAADLAAPARDTLASPPDAAGGADAPRDGGATIATACPADPDLALCLRFENAVRDESPAKLAMTTMMVAYEAGPDGMAASLVSDSRIQAAESATLASPSITIEALIKVRTLPASGERTLLVDYSRQYALVLLPGGLLRCRVNTGGSSFEELTAAPTPTVKPGVWTMVACTATASAIRLWIGGGERMSTGLAGPLVARNTTEPLLVGRNYPTSANPTTDPFLGTIDNVRIWRRVRTPAELCRADPACTPAP